MVGEWWLPRQRTFIFAKFTNSQNYPHHPPSCGLPGCHIGDLASLVRAGFIFWSHDIQPTDPAFPAQRTQKRYSGQFPHTFPNQKHALEKLDDFCEQISICDDTVTTCSSNASQVSFLVSGSVEYKPDTFAKDFIFHWNLSKVRILTRDKNDLCHISSHALPFDWNYWNQEQCHSGSYSIVWHILQVVWRDKWLRVLCWWRLS